MSESATNVPIEDVLSSIKRLVTEEGRERVVRKEPQEGESAPPRLVLTPALRVPEKMEVEAEPLEKAEPFQLSAEFVAPVAVDEIRFHKEERAIDPDAPWSDPEVTLHEAAAAVESRDRASENEAEGETGQNVDSQLIGDEADLARDAGVDEQPDEVGEADTDTNRSPVIEASDPEELSDDDLLLVSDAEAEPDTVELSEDADDLAESDDDAESAALETDDSAQDHTSDTSENEAAEPVEPALEPIDMRTATLSQKIQALEAAIAQTDDQWEPDGNAADTDNSARPVNTIPWEDDVSEPQSAASPKMPELLETEVVADSEPEPQDEEPAILDEESLRVLVSDIVREELQGALGERITRNVRKLVRREIHRALTAKELE
ncbi:MAG: hypothetical protein AB3N13_05635 [Arenibacterium sp.]